MRKWNRRTRHAVISNGDRIRVLSDRGLAFWLQAVQSMRHPADDWMRWLAEPDTTRGTETEGGTSRTPSPTDGTEAGA